MLWPTWKELAVLALACAACGYGCGRIIDQVVQHVHIEWRD